jgi:hypothetical protein
MRMIISAVIVTSSATVLLLGCGGGAAATPPATPPALVTPSVELVQTPTPTPASSSSNNCKSDGNIFATAGNTAQMENGIFATGGVTVLMTQKNMYQVNANTSFRSDSGLTEFYTDNTTTYTNAAANGALAGTTVGQINVKSYYKIIGSESLVSVRRNHLAMMK